MVPLLFRVARHSILAFLVSAIFSVVVLQAGLAGLIPVDVDEEPYTYRMELRLSAGPIPAGQTDPLMAELIENDSAKYDVAQREDGTWLVIRSVSAEQRRAISRELDRILPRHGFRRDLVRLSSRWADRVAEFVDDPSGTISRYSAIVPVLLAFGGVGFAAVAWVLRRRYPEPAWEAYPPGAARAGAIGLGIGCFALALVTGLEAVMYRLGTPVQEQGWVSSVANQGGGTFIAFLGLALVVAPIGEELFFRGHVFRHLAARGERVVAYLFSSGVFAAAHGNNPSGLPIYFAYGLVLAWSFDRWRSLVVPIVAHAVVNAAAIGALMV